MGNIIVERQLFGFSYAMDFMKEAAKKKIEEEIADQAPGYLKCFFPCCGGPVGTIEKFSFAIPADQRDDVLSAIEKYNSM